MKLDLDRILKIASGMSNRLTLQVLHMVNLSGNYPMFRSLTFTDVVGMKISAFSEIRKLAIFEYENISDEDILGLSKLTELKLMNDSSTKKPHITGKCLTNVKNLSLVKSKLTFSDIERAVNAEHISMVECEGIVNEFPYLPSLVTLEIIDMKLKSIPNGRLIRV